MGKCEEYSPTCEWEARMYSATNSENRCNRLSAYVFNADAKPWLRCFLATDVWTAPDQRLASHSWRVFDQESAFRLCGSDDVPGAVNIWVNGVEWDQSQHGQTGCFSQYSILPKANGSPVNIGTMAHDSWFQGAIGKVAIYDFLLSETQIVNHYRVMTGKSSPRELSGHVQVLMQRKRGLVLRPGSGRPATSSAGDAIAQIVEQPLPPLGEPELESPEREAVARGVARGDRVPAEVFDRDASLLADFLEADVQLGALVGGKGPWRQVTTRRCGGSQTRTSPMTNIEPSS